jgi:DNA (cytosine-5)-methyltransferase 1
MRYGSVCSGIEAATMGWHHMGWEPAFFSEIEEFPRQALEHHYPDVPCHGDFTTIGEDDYGSIELLVGGTPCQSFSVAGLRGGMADERGNLALEYLKLAQRKRPRWLVWENVPGVLSSNGGRDFGAFLGGLVECGYGWAYRICDAQYFGMAQRRRRVFVVGYLGDWRRAAAVLFERESLSGNPAPSREEKQEATLWPAECVATLNASFGSKQGLEDQHALGGASWFVPAKNVAGPLTAGMHKGPRGTEGVESNHIVASNLSVRRLTPTECERLQGFPDGFTEIPYRNKTAEKCPDGPRYKALGNSMAVPVMRWIGERIQAVEVMTDGQ